MVDNARRKKTDKTAEQSAVPSVERQATPADIPALVERYQSLQNEMTSVRKQLETAYKQNLSNTQALSSVLGIEERKVDESNLPEEDRTPTRETSKSQTTQAPAKAGRGKQKEKTRDKIIDYAKQHPSAPNRDVAVAVYGEAANDGSKDVYVSVVRKGAGLRKRDQRPEKIGRKQIEQLNST